MAAVELLLDMLELEAKVLEQATKLEVQHGFDPR